jgi:hypothetical protein
MVGGQVPLDLRLGVEVQDSGAAVAPVTAIFTS